MDLTATSKSYDENNNVVYGTGLAVEIPEGYVGLVFPRSSICKKDLFLTNSVGVIDSGYRGEIIAKFKHTDNLPVEYRVGERIAQLIIIPHPYIEFELANELSESERGSGGYGSSGR
jgi:dUTP pyrophosphatase